MLKLCLLIPLFSPAFTENTLSALLSGSCPSNKLPTESQYTAGYTSFCDTYMPETAYHTLDYHDPIRATFDLTQADGATAKWVYKIYVWWDGVTAPSLVLDHHVNRAICKDQFKMLLDSEKAGGMGTAWCVVDGTEGDRGSVAQSGNGGTVCVRGGSTKITIKGSQKLQVIFYSYRRDGT